MAINWKASYFTKDNSKYIDMVNIDESYAPKKKLLLTKLSFSTHPQLADKFLEFATSQRGKEIMKKFGFL